MKRAIELMLHGTKMLQQTWATIDPIHLRNGALFGIVYYDQQPAIDYIQTEIVIREDFPQGNRPARFRFGLYYINKSIFISIPSRRELNQCQWSRSVKCVEYGCASFDKELNRVTQEIVHTTYLTACEFVDTTKQILNGKPQQSTYYP